MAISPCGPTGPCRTRGQSLARGVEGRLSDLQLCARLFDAPHTGGAVLQQLLEALQAETRRLGFGLRGFDRAPRLDALVALRRCERRERHQARSATDTRPRLHARHDRQRAGDRRGDGHHPTLRHGHLATERARRRVPCRSSRRRSRCPGASRPPATASPSSARLRAAALRRGLAPRPAPEGASPDEQPTARRTQSETTVTDSRMHGLMRCCAYRQ